MSDYTRSNGNNGGGAGTVPVLAIVDWATAKELTVAQWGALAAGAGLTLSEFLSSILDLLF